MIELQNDFFDYEMKEKIFTSINKASSYFEGSLSKFYIYLKESKKNSYQQYNSIQDFQDLMEFTIFISQNWLDISSAFQTYLNPFNDYQKIYGLKNLIIHLNEGYKRLIHFEGKKRKESLLESLIKEIVKENEEFEMEYISIIKNLEIYSQKFQNNQLKYKRGLFVHYEGLPSAVYENSINIDVENLNNNALEYVKILGRIIEFVTKIMNKIYLRKSE